jgi:predicted RNase H-like HicB family nuclease
MLMKYSAVVWKEGNYFVAQCLNVEVSSFGDTELQALNKLEEALELYFEDEKNPPYAEINQPKIITHKLARA